MTRQSRAILVAACGNVMAADDAFGPLVARRLREQDVPDVEVIDLGMKPAGLLDHLEGRQGLILIDAAQPAAGFPAGSLLDIDFFSRRRPQLLHDDALSSHGLSLAHELELARRLDMLPVRVHLVAAAIRDTEVGQPPTAELLQLVEPAARRVVEMASRWSADA